jgi:hypothetical protein
MAVGGKGEGFYVLLPQDRKRTDDRIMGKAPTVCFSFVYRFTQHVS